MSKFQNLYHLFCINCQSAKGFVKETYLHGKKALEFTCKRCKKTVLKTPEEILALSTTDAPVEEKKDETK